MTAVVLHGGAGLPESAETLRVGRLSAELMKDGSLKYVRAGKTEVLRSLQVTVRDRNWETIGGIGSAPSVSRTDESLRVAFHTVHCQQDIDFRWDGSIELHADGTIIYSMNGEAHADFWKNRIGFCLLHPMDLAGSEVVAETAEGTLRSSFPELISPGDPFVNVRSMTITTPEQVGIAIRFEGDLFQTEDQRNWTDGSYKTFCTPLHVPYPVYVKQGTKINQSVVIRVREAGAPAADESAGNRVGGRRPGKITITGKALGTMPQIGTWFPSLKRTLTDREIDRLRRLRLSQLRCAVHLTDPEWDMQLSFARAAAERLGVGLDLEVVGDGGEAPLDRLAEQIRRAAPIVRHMAIYPASVAAQPEPVETRCVLTGASLRACQYVTSGALLGQLKRKLAERGLSARVGGGSRGNFAELNRSAMPLEQMDFLEYAINPQVHYADIASIAETLPAQAMTVRTAKSWGANLPVHIGSVTMKPRIIPYAADDDAVKRSQERERQFDPKLKSLFAAGWTLGSLASLAGENVRSVNFYEAVGSLGVVEEGGERVAPVFHLMSEMGEWVGGTLMQLRGTGSGSALGHVVGLAVETAGGQRRLALANLGGRAADIELDAGPWRSDGDGEADRTVCLRVLDEAGCVQAVEDPDAWRRSGVPIPWDSGRLALTISPFAGVFVDFPSPQ